MVKSWTKFTRGFFCLLLLWYLLINVTVVLYYSVLHIASLIWPTCYVLRMSCMWSFIFCWFFFFFLILRSSDANIPISERILAHRILLVSILYTFITDDSVMCQEKKKRRRKGSISCIFVIRKGYTGVTISFRRVFFQRSDMTQYYL